MPISKDSPEVKPGRMSWAPWKSRKHRAAKTGYTAEDSKALAQARDSTPDPENKNGLAVKESSKTKKRTWKRLLFPKRKSAGSLFKSNVTSSTKTSYEAFADEKEVDEVMNQRRETFYTCEDLDSILPQLVETEDSPVLLRFEQDLLKSGKQKLIGCGRGSAENLPYNDPAGNSIFSFDNDLFTGKAIFRFKDCPGENKEYFKGRKRRQQYVIQGSFKQPIKVGDIVTGYEFKRPGVNVPAKFLVRAGLKLVRNLAPTLKEDIFSEKPYVVNPMLQTIQTLDVSVPGHEPDITSREFKENNSLLFMNENSSNESQDENDAPAEREPLTRRVSNQPFHHPKKFPSFHLPIHLHKSQKKSRTKKERKKYFANITNGSKHEFVPGLIYTFEFYEDKLDVAQFKFILPFMTFDLMKYLDGQPLPMMGKVWTQDNLDIHGKYIFRFEIFHKDQLEKNKTQQLTQS